MSERALIVAMDRNRGIGLRGALPWRVPEDLKRFKDLTTGHAVIMGRKTYESIGEALPGRRNIVVTRGMVTFPGCEVAGSLVAALTLVKQDALPFIIGGAQLYAEALPLVTRIFITELDLDGEADTFFPELDAEQWQELKRVMGATPGVTFVDLWRKGSEK